MSLGRIFSSGMVMQIKQYINLVAIGLVFLLA